MQVPTTRRCATIRSTWAVGVPGVGQAYHAFIRRYVQTVSRLFPGALLHFEAIDPEHARRILHAYSRSYRVFSDVQGTGAATLAAIYAGIRVTGIPMKYQTVVA